MMDREEEEARPWITSITRALNRAGRPGPYKFETAVGALKGADGSIEITVRCADGFSYSFASRQGDPRSVTGTPVAVYEAILAAVNREALRQRVREADAALRQLAREGDE